MSGPSWRSTPFDFAAAPRSCSRSKMPTFGMSRSMMNLRSAISLLPNSNAHQCASPMAVAVGTRVISRPPHRSVRAASPHTAPTLGDGKTLIGPRMKDTRFWEPLVNQPVHASPVETRQLAASDEHPMPAFGDLGPECHERATVRRHRVVIEVAAHDIPKPLPLNRDRLVHAPSHLLFDHP